MKRSIVTALWLGAIVFLMWGSSIAAYAQSRNQACTREQLKGIVDKYLNSLAAHNPSILPLASNVRFTENGIDTAVGKGFWTTAGKVLLKRSAIDTGTCGTVTQAIIEENGKPIIFGVRLKLDGERITEIENLVAREKDFAFNPKGILETADQD